MIDLAFEPHFAQISWTNPSLLAQTDAAAASQLEQLGSTPFIVLVLYLIVLLGLGVYGWLKSRAGEEDYYLAGRGQGWIVSSLTIMATFFSSFALLGAPGMVYREGVVFALFSLNVPVSALCVYFFGCRIWKLGRKFGYVTPGDMISDYYGSRYSLRGLVALTGFLYAIPYVVMQIQSGGIISEKLFQNASLQIGSLQLSSFAVGSTVLAIITMVYIMIGGMRSVAWTDMIQGVLLISGMLVSGFAMFLVFGGPEQFGQRVMNDLPESSLTSPGNTGTWFWTMVLTVCVLGSSGSMVQPAQWMRYFSARNTETLRRGAMIFAVVLTSCFILGVMLIGLAGQVLYPLQFEYRAAWNGDVDAATLEVPEHLRANFQVVPADQEGQRPAELIWTWSGKTVPVLGEEQYRELAALRDDEAYREALQSLREEQSNRPAVKPNVKMKGDFNSILVVVLNEHIPRVLGSFGAVFASLLLVSIMAASMSTADSNLHALSAVLTRDVYDQFIRPQASENERVWVGRMIIVAATVLSLFLVIAGSSSAVREKYDFIGMIAMMGLMAIAFSAQLLPITVDMLFLRWGTGRGAAAGLAAGLFGAFLFGPLFALLCDALNEPPMLTAVRQFVDGLKFTPVHGSVWGLLFNVPVFVVVSLFTRRVPVEVRRKYARELESEREPA